MFSGIITGKAKILSVQWWRFTIENVFSEALSVGQSIAHDGACMTLTEVSQKSYSFFVMKESLAKTSFWEKKIWDSFNVELCIRADTRIDGHFVSGHIDTTWKISLLEKKDDNSLLIWVSFQEKYSKYTIEKWSIALNGTSLTIVDTKDWYISVSLIPLTQDWTNLWDLEIWDIINIEFDMLGKYILNTAKCQNTQEN